MTEITMMFTLAIIFTIKSVPLIVPRIESLEASTSQKSLQFLLYLRCVDRYWVLCNRNLYNSIVTQ